MSTFLSAKDLGDVLENFSNLNSSSQQVVTKVLSGGKVNSNSVCDLDADAITEAVTFLESVRDEADGVDESQLNEAIDVLHDLNVDDDDEGFDYPDDDDDDDDDDERPEGVEAEE